MRSILVLAPVLVLLLACESGAPPDQVASTDAGMTHVVDSIIPMGEALARFRQGLEEPTGLGGGADTRDELVSKIVRALEARDTMAFEDLSVSRAEWAWLYFPTNVLSKPPYELPPALAWFQLQEANRKGVLRALRELGGRDLHYRGYRCSPEPAVEGDNRIWTGCVVTLRGNDDGDAVAMKLFSAILERDGRFAVLSYDNDF
jgi:hypothetical protein